ncbi:hypothetical protein NKH95_01460 [Mesorhizobium sp. M0848]|uniref:hypothetical protein n=1 Tax=Mesorhizobium sp. M0848 TaxID=2957012 RepID=UPI003337360B
MDAMDMRLTAHACDTTATGNAYAVLTAKASEMAAAKAPEMATATHAFGMAAAEAAAAKASAVTAATTAVRHRYRCRAGRQHCAQGIVAKIVVVFFMINSCSSSFLSRRKLNLM